MTVQIRAARIRDIGDVTEMWMRITDFHVALDARFTPVSRERTEDLRQWLKRRIQSPLEILLIADDRGRSVGFLEGVLRDRAPLDPQRIFLFVTCIYVEEEMRRQGIGRRLYEEACDWARRKKAFHVELQVSERNKIGLRFWERLGCEEYVKQLLMPL